MNKFKFKVQVQITLFVPSGAIRFAASSKIQITHNHTPNTEIAYLTGMAKNNKNSKQSIYGKSISYLCFVLELRSKMAAGTKECLYLLVLNFGSLKRDPDGNIWNSACKGWELSDRIDSTLLNICFW